jgi:hypothetical protein
MWARNKEEVEKGIKEGQKMEGNLRRKGSKRRIGEG